MEKELNIAAILKDKPKGTKLWSSISGDCKYEYLIHDFINVWFQGLGVIMLSKKGKWSQCGETIIFPSKQMQDWSKFAWKKGDVLVSNDGGTEVIFDKWYDETYTSFYCKHYLNCEDENKIVYHEAFLCTTERYSLEDKDSVQTYINTIEERLGGKLNLKTLEIEYPKQEFKDGDIVICSSRFTYVFIYKEKNEYNNPTDYYVLLNGDGILSYNNRILDGKDLEIYGKHLRLATENEQQQLFDALAKEGKRWNPDTKQIEDLPKKCEFKPFDKVLARDYLEDKWMPNFFSCYDGTSEYKYGCIAGNSDNVVFSKYCIPYNEETAKLIGTTNNVEG